MKAAQVELLREPFPMHPPKFSDDPIPSIVTKSLPYVRAGRGRYVHRVRSGHLHQHTSDKWPRRRVYLAFRLWCGMSAFGYSSEFFENPPPGSKVCATCEGKAVGAGFPSAVILALRPIIFRPRVAS